MTETDDGVVIGFEYNPDKDIYKIPCRRRLQFVDLLLPSVWGSTLGVLVLQAWVNVPWAQLGFVNSVFTLILLGVMGAICLWRMGLGVRSLLWGAAPNLIIPAKTLLSLKYQAEPSSKTYMISIGHEVISRVINLNLFLQAWEQANSLHRKGRGANQPTKHSS